MNSIAVLMETIIAKVPDAQVLADLDACYRLGSRGNGGDAAVGDHRLLLASGSPGFLRHNPAVKAGVAWYGRLVGKVSDLTPRHPLDLAPDLAGAGAGACWRPGPRRIPGQNVERCDLP